MISYNLAPIPIWVLRDNAGEPLANGTMKAYRNDVRSEFKAVYQDAGGTIAWIQPIVFNAAGFQGPFYWASDENYFLEIFDSDGNLIKTVSNFNAPQEGGVNPVNNNIDFSNYITDSQWTYPVKSTFTPLTESQQIGTSNWFFEKDNTTATDTINLIATLGAAIPPYNPPRYFSYECTVAGTGENTKDLIFKFSNVYSFQSTEVTLYFWGLSPTTANEVEIYYQQYFGTGGTPAATVETFVTTFTLTGAWAEYSISFALAAVIGIIGTDKNDTLNLVFRFPRDTPTTIQMTNISLNAGNLLLPFEYLTQTNNATLQVPTFNSITAKNQFLKINETGYMNWGSSGDLYFLGSFVNTSIGTTPGIMPLVFAGGPYPAWFSANRFTPQVPCICIVNCWVTTPVLSENEIGFNMYLNGGRYSETSYSFTQNGTAGNTRTFIVSLNGTTDYIEFYGQTLISGAASITGNSLRFLII